MVYSKVQSLLTATIITGMAFTVDTPAEASVHSRLKALCGPEVGVVQSQIEGEAYHYTYNYVNPPVYSANYQVGSKGAVFGIGVMIYW